MSNPLDLTATAAVRALSSGELGAGELFEAYAARAREDRLNCFTWVADGHPPVFAPGTPLGGIPLAVKDLFCTKNVPSQSGSRILEGYLPPYTATVVERLQDAGVSLLAKTNQDEFAMGSSNENSAYGPVLNPWDPTRVPGGSSGG
ncbi:MAG: amidase, partial [Solirubrobacteraceae bacterium]